MCSTVEDTDRTNRRTKRSCFYQHESLHPCLVIFEVDRTHQLSIHDLSVGASAAAVASLRSGKKVYRHERDDFLLPSVLNSRRFEGAIASLVV
ncbi:hypothetical protein Plhal703r1_c02g0012681 [Plasmopara halstedii]